MSVTYSEREKRLMLGANVCTLDHLLEVAQDTEGAGVWRALFSEIRGNALKLLEKDKLPDDLSIYADPSILREEDSQER